MEIPRCPARGGLCICPPDAVLGVRTVQPPHNLFLDRVTLFIPKKPLADVPFDLLVQSTPYRWYHLVALREGIIADYFCAVYPTTVERLPWHERIKERSADLRAVREGF